MFDPAPWISKALASEGGHLFINQSAYSLNYENGWLTGYDPEPVKRAAISAGLPVCDVTAVDHGVIFEIVARGPMIAVGRAPDPWPWHAYSYAPLYAVLEAYRSAGAEIHNMPPSHVGPLSEDD